MSSVTTKSPQLVSKRTVHVRPEARRPRGLAGLGLGVVAASAGLQPAVSGAAVDVGASGAVVAGGLAAVVVPPSSSPQPPARTARTRRVSALPGVFTTGKDNRAVALSPC